MRILLINPPFYRFIHSCNSWMSPGLLYIGTACKMAGHDVKIINLDYIPTLQIRGLRTLFSYAPSFNKAADDEFHPVWQELQGFLHTWNPDVVGVTVTTPTRGPALKIAQLVREFSSRIRLIAGGPHATLHYKDLIEPQKGFDVIVRGEGEITVVEALQDIERGSMTAPGTIWSTDQGPYICSTRKMEADIDNIPFPDLTLYVENAQEDLDLGLIAGSRGCMGSCVFCASPVIWEHSIRMRSPESIINELTDRVQNFNIRHIYFIDDQFNYDLKRAKYLCDLMIKKRLDISWICEARVKPFDEELAILMRKAGCERIKLGIESGSNRVLKAMGKHITIEDSRRCVAMIKKTGLPVTTYVLLGMPGETLTEAMETVDLIEELSPDYVSISIVTPHPGTKLYTDMGGDPGNFTFHQHIDPGRVYRTALERLLAYNELPGRNRIKNHNENKISGNTWEEDTKKAKKDVHTNVPLLVESVNSGNKNKIVDL